MTQRDRSIPHHLTGRRTPVASLVEAVRFRAATTPDQTGYVLHHPRDDGPDDIQRLGYGELDERARRAAAHLRDGHRTTSGAQPGPRALLLYPPPSADYIAAFFGCMYAGFLPVPAYPPITPDQWGALSAVIADCDAEVVCTTADLQEYVTSSLASAGVTTVRTVATDRPAPPLDERAIHHPGPDAVAFLQYTSGSTGRPRGVVALQRNVLANLEVIESAFGHGPASTGVIWLPPYHDMGLIGGILTPLHQGFPVHLSSPLAFLRDPLSWPRLISEAGATTSGGPDFAYALCARKARPQDVAELRLDSWDVAFNGAEMLRPRTLDDFTSVFAPAGFRRSAFLACYGLAESTLMVTGTPKRREPLVLPGDAAVASGEPGDGELVIATPDGRRITDDGQEGEIWLRGPSVCEGYWGRPEDSAAAFGARLADGSGPYLRTGDLGYLHDGQLVVVGRLKELIIVRGRNIAPAAVEDAAWRSAPALRPGCVAAFALDGVHGEEVAVVAEVRRRDPAGGGPDEAALFDEAVREVRAAVARACGVAVRLVVLVPPGTVPKTTSGKVRRSLCRDLLLRGDLTALHRADSDSGGGTAPRPAPARASHDGLSLAEAVTRQAVAAVLRVPADTVDRRRSWSELGLDSLGLTEVAACLEERTGTEVPPGMLFDHPCVAALSDALERRSRPAVTAPDASATAARPTGSPVPPAPSAPFAGREPIAVVGMACRFPGGADDPDAYWKLLRRGLDVTGELPEERARLLGDEPSTGRRRLGALEGVECFDAPLFSVSAPEARAMDPQHRLLLETTWAALEDSGTDPLGRRGSRTGVYVGISAADYARIAERSPLSRFSAVGASPSVAAGRLSYHFGLRGPALSVDTACSSSLTAVHLAVSALRLGECEQAVVGGVNLVLAPEPTAALDRLGVLSPSGRCLPFDAAADGYVRGEGCGVIVLVPLSAAREQGLPVRAVIRGSALDHNGTGNGITAPSGLAQRDVITAALRDAGLPASRVGYLEAHGSGTVLGDAVELGSAVVLTDGRDRPLYLGSVKGVLGHLEAAAGIAGLIKTVLALEHGEIPPTRGERGPNTAADWADGRLAVTAEPIPWPAHDDVPRAAGVSSFGFSGTNVHVVLEQAPTPEPHPERLPSPARRFAVPVSARTDAALRASVERLAAALRRTPHELGDVAGTLAWHRPVLTARVAFQASETAELLDAMDKWLTDTPLPGAHGDAPDRAAAQGPQDPYDAACARFVTDGTLADLRALAPEPFRRVRLPSYPFERRPYWIGGGRRDR
ncbi:beta-ketoacyl synthase N-terminal-like domain-containing protein [Streptomyces syringium]|uniref:beta-ketoacyl synthase N-terminal-like domain-containing protein n=1 Tax=Streptomyces syringium TaxID=76729 RepID=UPI0033C366F3